MIRQDWSKRPLAVRLEACRVDREGMVAENAQRQHLGQSMAYQEGAFGQLLDRYALDLPDTVPAAADRAVRLLAVRTWYADSHCGDNSEERQDKRVVTVSGFKPEDFVMDNVPWKLVGIPEGYVLTAVDAATQGQP